MARKCSNCRWWYLENVTMGHVCVNGDSDEVVEFREEDDSCRHWSPEIEQDGDVTWGMD